MSLDTKKLHVDKKLFLLLFGIMFTVFLFTSDGHRYTGDEDYAEEQAYRITIQTPDPTYVPGHSKVLFEYPTIYPPESLIHGQICNNALICYGANIGHSLTEIPFIFINEKLHVFTKENTALSPSDFDDIVYIHWRNSLNPDFTFLELFYGPVFSALTTGIFFLVSRSFGFGIKISVALTFLYGLSTLVWAYANTSLNVVPATFFILLGFFLFRKFQKNNSWRTLLLSSSCLGFGFLVRQDVILFMIPLFSFLLYDLRRRNTKIKNFFSFVIPSILGYVLFQLVDEIRFKASFERVAHGTATILPLGVLPLHISVVGMFLSPGVGLLIFAPIFFIMFFSFPDFYSKHKPECMLFLSFVMLFVIYYGTGSGGYWHGLVSWGERYLYPVMPFLLLPLGASIEKRKSRIFKIILVVLASLGVFFNLVYVIQDVSWFVWSHPGSDHGLFGLGNYQQELNIHPAVIWTFEYSQLTQSIITAFTHLQPDILLLRALGMFSFMAFFITIIGLLVYLMASILKKIPNISGNLATDNS